MNFPQVCFESDEVLACIVTCGGLCPGLNTVIRELVCGLHDMYGVNSILGIEVNKCSINVDRTDISATDFSFVAVRVGGEGLGFFCFFLLRFGSIPLEDVECLECDLV